MWPTYFISRALTDVGPLASPSPLKLLDGGFAVGRFSDGRLAGERDPLAVYTKMDGGFNVNGLQKNCGLRKEADEHLVTYFPSLGDLGRRVHLLPHLKMNLNLSAEAIAIRVLQFSADTYEGKTGRQTSFADSGRVSLTANGCDRVADLKAAVANMGIRAMDRTRTAGDLRRSVNNGSLNGV
ncbi:E3 ubiquitin-protein ligase RING1 [Cucumis melo var. makuwa]|uniref:E3 ubiquitin-protein ligase RING1 n=1 Tax=Cucumis melo var. makuwa TaxID=1194695 RepID=A0A5A7TU29_CUCMM|nr:E3 ubiquitin-protein ligase RING1 [Cucumis melo var. makuwa]TYK04820.1 E3 ubiquitin-protein ligase RING1 [Cucumis melo var. makuwa]